MWKTCGKQTQIKLGTKTKKNYLSYMKTYYFNLTTADKKVIENYWLDARNEIEAWQELITIFAIEHKTFIISAKLINK